MSNVILTTVHQFSSEQQNADIQYNLDVSSNEIVFKIDYSNPEKTTQGIDENGDSVTIPSPEYLTPINVKLSLQVLKSMITLKPNTLVGISVVTTGNQVMELVASDLVNLSVETKNQKYKVPYDSKLQFGANSKPFLQILVTDVDGDFNDFKYLLFTPKTGNVTVDSNKEFTDLTGTGFSLISLLDPITCQEDTSYQNDEYIRYTVTSADYIDNVYLEPISGIFDKIRVSLTNGTGNFRVLKSSIEPGSSVSFKLGHYYYTGLFSL